jgi:manganese/iron transport system permease protein
MTPSGFLLSTDYFLLSTVSMSQIRATVALSAMGIAGAVLSVFVVLRRWAYMGEGISHAGFGGVGTALLLSLAFPSLNNQGAVYCIAAAFALATAMAVAWLSRARAVSGDTAIGIFVAVTLAWGFIAFKLHDHAGYGGQGGWENYLLGDVDRLSLNSMILGVAMSAVVVMIVAALGRQILSYCFDPILAEVSGVPAGFIHYLLIFLVGIVIVVGMRLAGNLLVPALLVLPGATGLAVSQRLKTVMAVSIGASLIASLLGLLVTVRWHFIPPGPAVVFVLFLEFIAAHLRRVRPVEG